jgi:hypothetical protein
MSKCDDWACALVRSRSAQGSWERTIRKDERGQTLGRIDNGVRGVETGNSHLREREGEMKQRLNPQKEVAMHSVPRCSVCDNEDPKVISLRAPAREHYCGRLCLYQGQKNFIRGIRRMNAEAAS